MDIKVTAAPPSDEERDAVDAVLGPAVSAWAGGERDLEREGRTAFLGGREARSRRDLLLPALHAVQNRFGWVSEPALGYICRRLTVPPAEAHAVLTFYHLLSATPRPPRVAHICDDIACRAVRPGALPMCDALEARLGPERQPAGDGELAGQLTWVRSPCLGQCERAPAALVLAAGETPTAVTLAPATVEGVMALLRAPTPELADIRELQADLGGAARLEALRASVPQAGDPSLRLLARAGTIDPGSLEAYRQSGGLKALGRAREVGPAGVIAEVAASGLVGRGGAAFPTARKWEAVGRQAARPHYLVCNADESEPGTFKDRLLMEEDPFALIEGMAIGALAADCEQGFLYLRGEYPLAARRLERALEQARQAGVLGPDARGPGLPFDIEIRRGGGAYICGEETALFNSIEGQRGEPRSKPPFPVEVGLFDRPTVVNNVETLSAIPLILEQGGAAFAAFAPGGTATSTGPKLFCVSGHVVRPGLYEVPYGQSLRELIALAGGVPGGAAIRGVLLGGAAGMFVGPGDLDAPLTLEGARAIGATLGSGVVLVLDDRTDLPDVLRRIAAFFRDESCGQCVPCRVGTVRQEELLSRLRRQPVVTDEDLCLLTEVGQAMRDASICGLGQTASNAIESAVERLSPFGRLTGAKGAAS